MPIKEKGQNATQIANKGVSTTAPTNGQVLTYNSTSGDWEPAAATGASNAFATIAVSGQDNVVADSGSDTLTIAAGANCTITTTAASDTVTIAATSGGEWTDTGTLLHPADLSGAEAVVIGGTTAGGADIALNADGSAVFNEQAAGVDFRIESVGLTVGEPDVGPCHKTLFVDGSENRVMINAEERTLLGETDDPQSLLHIKAQYVNNSTTLALAMERGITLDGGTGVDVNDFFPAIRWYSDDTSINSSEYSCAAITAQAAENFTGTNTAGTDLVFFTHAKDTDSDGPTERFRVESGGAVALKEISAPSATADYSKIYAKEYGNDSNTVLLLTGDGSNDGTTFTDSSSGGTTHTFAAVADAHTDTGTKKYGTASMQFDGTGDSVHLSTTHADFDFGAGDFTVDGWFNFSSVSASIYLFEIGTYTAGLSWLWSNSDYFVTYVSSGTKVITNTTASNNWEPVTGQWYHLALQRRRVSNTTGRMSIFVDGIELCHVTTAAALASITSATHGVAVGSECASPGGTCMNGFIDELRVSNVARYRGNFTPPGSAYPLTGLFTKDSSGTEKQLDV